MKGKNIGKTNRCKAMILASDRLDKVGAMASLLCAVHCAVLPLVVTFLPIIGLSFLASERIEWLLVGASAVMGATSLGLGYREHRSRRALLVLAGGLALLAAGRIIETKELLPDGIGVALIVAGGVSVAISHLINRSLCLRCRACSCRTCL